MLVALNIFPFSFTMLLIFSSFTKNKLVLKYPELNTEINTLKKELLPAYYKNFIKKKLFKYELLK